MCLYLYVVLLHFDFKTKLQSEFKSSLSNLIGDLLAEGTRALSSESVRKCSWDLVFLKALY